MKPEPQTANAPGVGFSDLLATPTEIPTTKAYQGICTVANIYGTEIAIVAGSAEALAAAWARLMPTVPFKTDKHQHVIVLSAKEPLFRCG